MKAVRLRCEYLLNPLGIDIRHPRLFWNCEGGIIQSSYQIRAFENESEIYDSGKVESPSMTWIEWPLEPVSRQRVTWQVKLWDEKDREGEWSEEAFFEYGLLDQSDWQAEWITGNYKPQSAKRYPTDCFRKTFRVNNPAKARLSVTACGLYEVKINGVKAGDQVFTPGHTDYRKRIQYQTYDVTSLIIEGENVITAELAVGWYRGSCGAWGLTNQYGRVTKLLARLEITDSSGNVKTVVTDSSWQWSDDGPVRFADNKDGEVIDAAYEATYTSYAKETACKVIPCCSNNVPVRKQEHLKGMVKQVDENTYLFDFGQNIAGFIAFDVTARSGQKVQIQCGELLDENGRLTLKNIQLSNKNKTTPLQKVEYTCREGKNHYETRFAVFGFQYAEIVTEIPLEAQDVTAIAVYSDMECTSEFESSNELLNRFYQNTLWALKNNSLDIPTDCPTRERHGWSGDAQIFVNTASYLMMYAPFARKYERDLTDWQRKDGCFPHIAPEGGADFYMRPMNGSVGWADAGILIPWRLYQRYGDRDCLTDNYSAMRRYAEFMIGRIGRNGFMAKPLHLSRKNARYAVNSGQSYGEWAEPKDVRDFVWTDFVAPHPEESTAYTYYTLSIMAKIAHLLGRTDDYERYMAISAKVKEAYQELVETPQHSLDTDRQAKLVRPLYMGLLNEEQETFAKKRLLAAMEHYGWRIGTGFLSTPLILYVLSAVNPEYAYRLLENEEIPGWLAMPKNGATSVWEGWEGQFASGGTASLNHYSKGAVLEWVFDTMCGVRVDGENHFEILPCPGGSFTHASFTYQSIYGKVCSAWKKEEDRYVYTIRIPSNCTADLCLPSGIKEKLTCGEYTFEEQL